MIVFFFLSGVWSQIHEIKFVIILITKLTVQIPGQYLNTKYTLIKNVIL